MNTMPSFYVCAEDLESSCLNGHSLYPLGHPPASVVNEMKKYKEEMNINYSIFVQFQRNHFLNGYVPFQGESRDSVS